MTQVTAVRVKTKSRDTTQQNLNITCSLKNQCVAVILLNKTILEQLEMSKHLNRAIHGYFLGLSIGFKSFSHSVATCFFLF